MKNNITNCSKGDTNNSYYKTYNISQTCNEKCGCNLKINTLPGILDEHLKCCTECLIYLRSNIKNIDSQFNNMSMKQYYYEKPIKTNYIENVSIILCSVECICSQSNFSTTVHIRLIIKIYSNLMEFYRIKFVYDWHTICRKSFHQKWEVSNSNVSYVKSSREK